MQKPNIKTEGVNFLNIVHDPQRKILEILSLFRVMNNYYYKKKEIQNQVHPFVLNKFKEGLRIIKKNIDWLFTIPTALDTLSEDLSSKKDSFKFPDGLILFEAWMNLGIDALFPQFVLHYKFPGFLKGEKSRNVFQFIYSFSRGFGFPISFYPAFYQYRFKLSKLLEPLFKWGYTVSHKANQAIFLANRKLRSKRHHPGEFESVIISEHEKNVFKGINTLLHGYFTTEAKLLGKFSNLEEALQKVKFSYTIGDHAMSVKKDVSIHSSHRYLKVPIISYDSIVQKYDIDFYSYINNLMALRKILNNKILGYKRNKKKYLKSLNFLDKILFRIDMLIPKRRNSRRFFTIKKLILYKNTLEKLKELMWTTPLSSHTIHEPTIEELKAKYYLRSKNVNQDSTDSILLTYIKLYEKEQKFVFEERDIIDALEKLRDNMAKMWLYFKERHFKYAERKLKEIHYVSLDDSNYKTKIKEYLKDLIPIFSVYEIFNRSLAEIVYPESVVQTKRLGSYIARFFAYKYNPIGVSLMNLFNKLAFYNWSYLIKKRNLNYKQFFDFISKLSIWKNVPEKNKTAILNS